MATLCLVPTPLRASRAARLLCDAGGGLLFGGRIEVPAQLAARVLAAAGDPRPLLSPLAERLLALEAAGAAFHGVEVAGGVARAATRAVAELRAGEVTADLLALAAASAAGAVSDRLLQAERMLRAYEHRLERLGALDAAGALRAAAGALDAGAPVGDAARLDLLVLEAFVAAPPPLWALLAAVAARARRVHARIPHFPDRPDLAAAEPLLRALEALAAKADTSVSLERLDERGPALAAALATVGAPPAADPAPAVLATRGELRAAAGAGAAGEAAEAAELVSGWLEAGMAPDEVAIFTADPGGDGPRLARALAARGIGLAPARGAPLADVPVIRLARALLAAAPRPGRRALEALLASSYLRADAPPRPAELLDRAGALDGRVDPEAALRARAERLTAPAAAKERAALLRLADAAATLGSLLAPLASAGTAREHASRLRGLVAAAGIRRRAARAEPELARRDLAALAALDDQADALAQALGAVGRGAERLGAREWRALLDVALGAAALPAGGPAAGAVQLWPLQEAPGVAARAALVVGAARGKLPATARADPLLGDAERIAVNQVAHRLALALSSRRRDEAQHAAFCALAAGRDALGLTWAAAGPEGAGDLPAPVVVELLAAAGLAVPAPRPGPVPAASPPAPATRVELPAALLPALHAGLPAEWTPSQLETWARCPFRSFLELACRLRERDDPDLDLAARDEGSLAHAVLERFLVARAGRGSPLRAGPEERAALERAADDVFAEFEGQGRVGDPALWPGKRALVVGRLLRVLEAEAGAADDGLAPVLVEHRFGGEGGAPPLELGEGDERVRLRGRVDRVDASPGVVRVLDWKNAKDVAAGRKKATAEAVGVENFQLPAYLLAAARALPGRTRLEAGYVFLRTASRSPMFVAAPDDPLLALDAAGRAAARDAGVVPFADRVVDAVRAIRSGRFPIAPRACDGCGFGAVCRAEGSEEDAA